MKVYGKCKSCKNEIGYRTNANTRVEFAMEDGEIKEVAQCKLSDATFPGAGDA